MSMKDPGHATRRFRLDENLRGAVIVVVGSAALVGLAFGAMVVLTSPGGWATKAANSAMTGEQPALVSYGAGDSQ